MNQQVQPSQAQTKQHLLVLKEQTQQMLQQERMLPMERRITLVTAPSQQSVLEDIAIAHMNQFPGLDITTLALSQEEPLSSQQMISQLCFEDLGEEVLLVDTLPMQDCDLSSMEEQLEVKVNMVSLTAEALFAALLARDL